MPYDSNSEDVTSAVDFAQRIRPEIITGYESKPADFEILLEEGETFRHIWKKVELTSVRSFRRGSRTDPSLRFISCVLSLPLVKASNFDDPVQPSSIFDTIKIIIVTILCTIITIKGIPYLFPSSAPAEPIVTIPTVDETHVVEPPVPDAPEAPGVDVDYRPRWIDEVSTQTIRVPSVDTLTQTERTPDPPTGEVWIAPGRGEKYHRRADCRWLLCAKVKKPYTPCNYCFAPSHTVGGNLGRGGDQSAPSHEGASQVDAAASSSSSRSMPSRTSHQYGHRSSPADVTQREDWQHISGSRQTSRNNSGPSDFELPDTYDEFRKQFGPGRHGRNG